MGSVYVLSSAPGPPQIAIWNVFKADLSWLSIFHFSESIHLRWSKTKLLFFNQDAMGPCVTGWTTCDASLVDHLDWWVRKMPLCALSASFTLPFTGGNSSKMYFWLVSTVSLIGAANYCYCFGYLPRVSFQEHHFQICTHAGHWNYVMLP